MMVGGHDMDRDGDRYEGGSGPGIVQYPCSPASSSSSSNSEMRLRVMARAVNSQRAAGRHRMSRHDYELIVSYLKIPENFAAITGGGRKMKIGGKNWTKVTTCDHMAVSLCVQGFPPCTGSVMGKKYNQYLQTYKNARIFYKSTAAGPTDEEIAAELSFEQKMAQKCHFFRMHVLYGAHANIEPHAVGDSRLPVDCIFDSTALFPDSQPVPNVAATAIHLDLFVDKEEATDREEDPMDFLDEEEVDVVDYQTGPDGGGLSSVPTATFDADGGPDIANQTARSALDVEEPQPDVEAPNVPQAPSRGGVSQHSVQVLKETLSMSPPVLL
ncbi:hypothetical protein R1sor_024676 [Riccia sorocarpa]|uniref:Uncharacterized protein n=1 Tax=Riccia sorocarpa TaxID=122646 RepID=A0ABD3GR59_9MARC